MTSNCTVQSLDTFLYGVDPGLLTAVNASRSLSEPIDLPLTHTYPLIPPDTAASHFVLHKSSCLTRSPAEAECFTCPVVLVTSNVVDLVIFVLHLYASAVGLSRLLCGA